MRHVPHRLERSRHVNCRRQQHLWSATGASATASAGQELDQTHTQDVLRRPVVVAEFKRVRLRRQAARTEQGLGVRREARQVCARVRVRTWDARLCAGRACAPSPQSSLSRTRRTSSESHSTTERSRGMLNSAPLRRRRADRSATSALGTQTPSSCSVTSNWAASKLSDTRSPIALARGPSMRTPRGCAVGVRRRVAERLWRSRGPVAG